MVFNDIYSIIECQVFFLIIIFPFRLGQRLRPRTSNPCYIEDNEDEIATSRPLKRRRKICTKRADSLSGRQATVSHNIDPINSQPSSSSELEHANKHNEENTIHSESAAFPHSLSPNTSANLLAATASTLDPNETNVTIDELIGKYCIILNFRMSRTFFYEHFLISIRPTIWITSYVFS